ncbi:hypothetical protein AB0C87_25240 [Actinomadura sp. NPDC048021]|uniref:hypothetical protein n=1 Tax=Actinomadura sp. NPDC048021 TaxID=3155385 RepID=UPI00340474C0
MTVKELIAQLEVYPGDWEVTGEDLNYWYKIYGLNDDGEKVVIDIDRRFYECI